MQAMLIFECVCLREGRGRRNVSGEHRERRGKEIGKITFSSLSLSLLDLADTDYSYNWPGQFAFFISVLPQGDMRCLRTPPHVMCGWRR